MKLLVSIRNLPAPQGVQATLPLAGADADPVADVEVILDSKLRDGLITPAEYEHVRAMATIATGRRRFCAQGIGAARCRFGS